MTATDKLIEQALGIGLALLGRLDRHILEHHLDTGDGGNVGNARAHHAGAEYTDFLRHVGRRALGTGAAGIDLVQLEPEGANHVLRHLAGGQLGEVARLDQLGGVEVDLCAFDGGTHDLLRRREAALGLVTQHARGDGQHLRHRGAGRSAARNPVAGGVPGLHRLGIGGDPGAGLGQHLLRRLRQIVDQAGLEGLLRAYLAAFGEVRQRLLDTQQAHHAHHAATARQQAEGDFRQAQQHAAVIQGNAVMAGQADFPAAPQCSAIDGGHHRLAEGFQAAQLALDAQHHLVEGIGVGLGDLDQLIEVAAGEEGLLGRGDDHAGDAVLLGFEAFDGLAHGLAVHRVHGVGALAGHVHGQDNDIVLAFFVTDGVCHFLCPMRRRRSGLLREHPQRGAFREQSSLLQTDQIRSMMVAMPMPPPTQSVARP
ncbi:hypothetical protein D9M70_270340 [compost metagenome]